MSTSSRCPTACRFPKKCKIYEKLLRNSSLAEAPCAPDTLRMLAQFSVLTRLKDPENSSIYSKLRIYDGENLKDIDPKAKSIQEYRDNAGVDEGMDGLSTRFAFKILSKVFNFDSDETAANPVHLLYVLEKQIEQEQFPADTADRYMNFLKEYLTPALHRLPEQGNPDGLPRVLLAVRAEHLRSLHYLCRSLDPGPGLPQPRNRRNP